MQLYGEYSRILSKSWLRLDVSKAPRCEQIYRNLDEDHLQECYRNAELVSTIRFSIEHDLAILPVEDKQERDHHVKRGEE